MEQEKFPGVVLSRPGMTALLSDDGQRVTLFSSLEIDQADWASLLDELHSCGLPADAEVLDEWTDGPTWVTVIGKRP